MTPLGERRSFLSGSNRWRSLERSAMVPGDRVPLVSIVMPVYNGERYLPEALDSLLSQSFTDFELIVVDDGSTDRTPQILETHAKADRRIQIQRQINQGVVRALIVGTEMARGTYIARADADDLSHLERLREQVKFCEIHPDVVLLAGAFLKMYPDGNKVTVTLPTRHEQIMRAQFIINNIHHAGVMMRRAAFERAGGYSPKWRHLEDYELWFRLGAIGHIASLSEPLTTLRVHRESISGQNELFQVRRGVVLRAKNILNGQYPPTYIRFLIKPLLKACTPGLVLSGYRAILGRQR